MFSWNNFSINTRIGRIRYIAMNLLVLVVLPFIFFICIYLIYLFVKAGVNFLYLTLAVFFITVFVTNTIFDIQRLHDINLSGWIVLVKFIPVVGFILPIILIFIPGDKTTNTYGDPPQPDEWSLKISLIIGIFIFIAFFLFGYKK